jgi:hypothetical protein
MRELTEKEKEKILTVLSDHIHEGDINSYIAEYVFGWTKIQNEFIDLDGNITITTGLPWVYNFHTEQHFWLGRREVPNSVGKDFDDFHSAVEHFCGIKAEWDGIAWNVTLDKLEGGKGEKVSACEASFNYALAKAAILAFAGIWNIRIHLSGVSKI